MVFVSIITLFGLGLVAAILLSIASRVFYVKEDPRVEAVLEVLPGANCGVKASTKTSTPFSGERRPT